MSKYIELAIDLGAVVISSMTETQINQEIVRANVNGINFFDDITSGNAKSYSENERKYMMSNRNGLSFPMNRKEKKQAYGELSLIVKKINEHVRYKHSARNISLEQRYIENALFPE